MRHYIIYFIIISIWNCKLHADYDILKTQLYFALFCIFDLVYVLAQIFLNCWCKRVFKFFSPSQIPFETAKLSREHSTLQWTMYRFQENNFNINSLESFALPVIQGHLKRKQKKNDFFLSLFCNCMDWNSHPLFMFQSIHQTRLERYHFKLKLNFFFFYSGSHFNFVFTMHGICMCMCLFFHSGVFDFSFKFHFCYLC